MKNKIKGWSDIFKFTYIQGMKTKSAIITNIILCVIALVSMPVMTIIEGKDSDKPKTKTTIEQVKVIDNTGLNIIDDLELLKSEDLYGEDESKLYVDLEYKLAEINYEELDEDSDIKDIYIFEEDEKNAVYLEMTGVEDSIYLSVVYDGKSNVKSEDAEDFKIFVENNFDKVLIKKYGVDEDTLKIMDCEVVTNVKKAEVTNNSESVISGESAENTKDESVNGSEAEGNADEKEGKDYSYPIIYGLLMITMFILAFGGERIAMSIATEKTSKVMEYLMTSVKPMAVVVGKILSSLAIIFTQVILIGISFIVSSVINKMLNGGKIIPDMLVNIIKSKTLSSANPGTILLGVLILVGGFIFYALIAALAGASVSKLDELADGVKLFTFTLLIGAYIGIFIVSSDMYEKSNALIYAAELFPITSLFITPGTVITGYTGVVMGIASLVVMIIGIILLTLFVSNVYESMIYYNGQTLKLKDIINISKETKRSNSKKTEKEE